MLCRDLSELGVYARVDNRQFRLLKAANAGFYTFILEATKEVPRRLSHPSRKTIGLRVPQHRIVQCLLEELGYAAARRDIDLAWRRRQPDDADTIRERLEKLVDLIIDGGVCAHGPSTVIDLTGPEPEVVRVGRGDPAVLGL